MKFLIKNVKKTKKKFKLLWFKSAIETTNYSLQPTHYKYGREFIYANEK